jgi:lipopolysaccharide transport system ATP-binding protein
MKLPEPPVTVTTPNNFAGSQPAAAEPDTVIQVENLSKSYLIGHENVKDESFRELVMRHAANVHRKAADMIRGRQIVQGDVIEEFWALKDISFEVRRGQVLGIIGRNGAGKSTLLKILSRITLPTQGRVRIIGQVASLLEVGTGFHPELTGRENILLNGAILGMSRREIRAKFDAIVSFADIERFLDTPVKRYSSGMYVRLAFSIAAHLTPDILIVDEVLAVGDVAFQKKCLGKMHDVAEAGRTVIFVSHNLAAVMELTDRVLWIERGHLQANGPSRQMISSFLKSTRESSRGVNDLSIYRRSNYCENGCVEISSLTVCGDNIGVASIEMGHPLVIELGITAHRPVESGIIVIHVLNEQLEVITALHSQDAGYEFSLKPGNHKICCRVPAAPLIPGNYLLNFGLAEPNQRPGQPSWDVLELVPGFRVTGDDNLPWMKWSQRPGIVFVDNCEWNKS